MSDYTNGPSDGGKYIDTFDSDDPEYVRQMMRPVEVKEDVRQMEERKRVKLVLHSRAFRDELEELVIEQLSTGSIQPGGSLSIQQLSDIMQPRVQSSTVGRGIGPCIPIADIRDVDTLEYDKGEKLFRCKLAALYRLVDLFGWSRGIQSYITGRISQDFEHFLIAPYGMMHHEVTASSLVKVDMRGDILDLGSTTLGANKTGFSLHSAIYASRPDVKCIIHVRSTSAVSVSALKCGFLALCPEAALIGDVSYFDYSGGFVDLEQRDKLRRALGPNNKVLVLRNFGIIVGGETVEETFFLVRQLMTGVETMLLGIKSGLENLKVLTDEERRNALDVASNKLVSADGRKWRRGEQEFETLMKHLDNAGYRTGYLYHESAGSQMEKSIHIDNDVIVPPASSSFVYSFDEETARTASPVKPKIVGKQKKESKSDWLSTSKKEDLEESITSNLDATKTSKWAPEETSTPIKPELAQQSQPRRDVQHFESMLEERNEEVVQSRGGAGEPLATALIMPQAEEKSKSQPAHAAAVRNEAAKDQPPPARNVLTDARSGTEERDHSPTKEVSSHNESPTKDKKKKKGLNIFKKK